MKLALAGEGVDGLVAVVVVVDVAAAASRARSSTESSSPMEQFTYTRWSSRPSTPLPLPLGSVWPGPEADGGGGSGLRTELRVAESGRILPPCMKRRRPRAAVAKAFRLGALSRGDFEAASAARRARMRCFSAAIVVW